MSVTWQHSIQKDKPAGSKISPSSYEATKELAIIPEAWKEVALCYLSMMASWVFTRFPFWSCSNSHRSLIEIFYIGKPGSRPLLQDLNPRQLTRNWKAPTFSLQPLQLSWRGASVYNPSYLNLFSSIQSTETVSIPPGMWWWEEYCHLSA
jgi:hypothetical protein